MLDTILRGGTVIDGTGRPGFGADVLIRAGVIAEIAAGGAETWLRTNPAATVVDCSGLQVVPGFVDLHCHSDLTLFAYPKSESRISQGVTLEVLGNCGMSPAPTGGDASGLAGIIGTIDVRPDAPERRDWSEFADWLDALEALPTATNVAALIGHGSARWAVSGSSARALTPDEQDELDAVVDRGLAAGAVGLSLGLMYAPGESADTEELLRLARVVAARDGLLAAHLRDYAGDGLFPSVAELLEIAERSGVRTQISHLRQVADDRATPGKRLGDVRALIRDARARVDVAADAYPYVAGHTNLVQLFPSELRGLGPAEIADRCARDPDGCARMLSDAGFPAEHLTVMKARANPEAVGRTADQLGPEPFAELVSLLSANAGLVDVAVVGSTWSGVDDTLLEPWVSVASDGTALSAEHSASMPHPRSWGAFPAATERLRNLGVPVEEIVHRMTDAPAARVGLTARLEVGHRADVVVLDLERFRSPASYASPADPAVGVSRVIVNGTTVFADGIHLDAFPGTLLRKETS